MNAQSGWKGIIPLVTTKDEVERKLGKPQQNGFYEFEEGRVLIRFATTRCEEKTRCECLVSIGTVLYVSVEPYQDIKSKDLELNPKDFKKTHYTEHFEHTSYSDDKAGIVYDVQNELVTNITYYQTKSICDQILKKQ